MLEGRLKSWQEPSLWVLKGYAVVTRHGSIASQGRVVLSPEEHGVCHRLREPDLIGDLVDEERWEGLTWHARVLVLSQPWGHTIFHFVAECLPKIMIARELLGDSDLLLHVPLSSDTPHSAERSMLSAFFLIDSALAPSEYTRRLTSCLRLDVQ
ncbi:hypothetical protein GUITHDRAFT_99765 [Guillardia theta CCMP2712]|uniref:Uncharacterized protein n=1 Tax=Guillardia theta (strain CCMP2712) TaxID=905079 RepID=L1K175_GUITC|nr:hypothetical protein GUITHDRAFT_99765 [Guillardia theta CCMP2712]EKX54289.1 hypothetical protein GUITHDRAFT_99765 [Guillardia theta CCMP2712]|eukprot:XP_005841269.1 hypothetical protein GUITHDRAFT_99765 [Guillardia theta CCMP2712]